MVERTQFLYRKRMEPIEEQIEKLQEQLREMRLKRQETINYWTKVMSLANSVTESEKTSNEDDFVSE